MRHKNSSPRNQVAKLAALLLTGTVVGAAVWVARFGASTGELKLPMLAAPTKTSVEPTPEEDGSANYPHIFIATAGINEAIIESTLDENGWRVSHLENRVGHLEGTGWLGTPGNIVLAGHVELKDGRPGIFAKIGNLQKGDVITLTENGMSYEYAVVEVKVVESDDLSVVYPTETERVTLITCTGYDFLNNTYEQRIVVVAER